MQAALLTDVIEALYKCFVALNAQELHTAIITLLTYTLHLSCLFTPSVAWSSEPSVQGVLCSEGPVPYI